VTFLDSEQKQSRVQSGRKSEIVQRDVDAILWLSEQYGARLDVLGALLGDLANRGPLGRRSTRDVVSRWQKMGLARTSVSLGAVWVTPTKKGMQAVGSPHNEWPFTATQLNHVHAVGVLRLVAAKRWPEAVWLSERDYRRELGDQVGRWHIPDATVELPRNEKPDRYRTALEVELTPKTRRRLQIEVLGRLGGDIERVIYFTPPEHVERLQEDVTFVMNRLPITRPVTVQPLPILDGVSVWGVPQ
jgi:hypothetical protein